MNELFRVIGVSLIHQRVQARYDPAAIARWVDAAAARPGGAAPLSPRPLRPASWAQPKSSRPRSGPARVS